MPLVFDERVFFMNWIFLFGLGIISSDSFIILGMGGEFHMSLIPCGDDCVYQVDGYCTLETPTVITNHTGGCVHFLPRTVAGHDQLFQGDRMDGKQRQI